MSSLYTPNSANGNWSTVTLPTDGDNKNVASVRVPFEAIADKVVRMLDKTNGGTINGSLVTSSSVAIGGTSTFLIDAGVQEEHSNTPNFINGALFSIGGTFTCQRPASFTQTVTCSNGVNALNCTGPVTVSGTGASFYSNGTLGSEFATDCQFDAKIKRFGAGHDVFRMILASDVDHTYTINDWDLVRWNVLAANRNLTFLNTGAQLGCVIEISLKFDAGANNLLVKRHDGTTILTMRGDGVSGSIIYGKLWHDGTDWVVAAFTKN